MPKRKSYKTLWLREYARADELKHELDGAERELAEINAALAPFGLATMERESAKGDGPIHLPPLEFVAMRAFMESHACFGSKRNRSDLQNYSWRERPIFRLAANEKTA